MKPQEVAFLNVLKKIIPDGSIFQMRYTLPHFSQREVHIIMKYSILPTSKFIKFKMGDGRHESGVSLHVQIEELWWKGDFDNEWEKVSGIQNIPSGFRPLFEDHMWEKIIKTMGTEHVEVWFSEPVAEQV